MKKNLFLLLIMLLANSAIAQKINMDSLVEVVVKNSAAIKPKPLLNSDSLFRRITEAKTLTERIKLTYQIIGYGDHGEDNLTYHNKIYKWAAKNYDDALSAIMLSELAFNVDLNGDNAEALRMAHNALMGAKMAGDDQAIGIVADNLGGVYLAKNQKIARDYFHLGLKHSLKGKDYLFAFFNLSNLVESYSREQRMDSAMYYFEKSFQFAVTHKVSSGIGIGLITLTYLAKNEKSALRYATIAKNIAFASNDIDDIEATTYVLSRVFSKYQHLDSALHYAYIAYQSAASFSYSTKARAALKLTQIYEKLKRPDSALKYTGIYYKLRLKLVDVEKIQRANLSALAEQQRRQEAATAALKFQARQQKTILIAVVAGLVLLGLFSFFLVINNRQKHIANKLLQQQQAELKSAQAQLIQSAKMATLCELTAGIAHEIQNPLNFVNNFSEVSVELLEELKEEVAAWNKDDVLAIADDLTTNLQKINHHGKRADFIVKGMLQHSRTSSVEKQPTNINTLADEFLKLSFHGQRAKDKNFNADIITNFDYALPKANIAQQDIGLVFLNLFNNAFYAVNERKKAAEEDYVPEVTVTTSTGHDQVTICVKDNGIGIPSAIKDKIMQPFFTTKPTGEGTGLGLSLSYDIVVKGHGGKIDIESKDGEGSEFIVILPINL